MLNLNNDLDKALDILYDYSRTFRLSIDSIQRLSQHLKLDTFIDTDAYAHLLDQSLKDNQGNSVKFQRLSIAGSLILIDIDFVDTNIYRVAFSLANQAEAVNPIQMTSQPEPKLPNIEQGEECKIINLEFPTSSANSLLNITEIENILLKNLQQPYLNEFPNNLKYVANLDRLSTSQTDLFNYMDNVGWLLTSCYNIEIKDITTNEWLYKEGLLNAFGKILYNIPNHIGIFIEYWQDFKYLNHEFKDDKKNDKNGDNYNLLLDVTTKHFSSSIDYIGEARDQIWEINDIKYQLNFPNNSYLATNRTTSNESSTTFESDWNLALNLNKAIYLPINLLEFIGINYYEEVSIKNQEFYEKLNDEKEILLINDDKKLAVRCDIHSKFVAIKSLGIKRLFDIPSFLVIFRNHLILTNLLKQLTTSCQEYNRAINANNNIRNSMRKSYKLSNDIPDDQIFNLNSMGVVKDDISLTEFLNESNANEKVDDADLVININEISYKKYAISISLKGKFTKPINLDFTIANGELKTDEMIDDDVANFIKSLELSEDLIKSLKLVF